MKQKELKPLIIISVLIIILSTLFAINNLLFYKPGNTYEKTIKVNQSGLLKLERNNETPEVLEWCKFSKTNNTYEYIANDKINKEKIIFTIPPKTIRGTYKINYVINNDKKTLVIRI